MSCCYSVYAKILPKNESETVEAMKRFIIKRQIETGAHFNLEYFGIKRLMSVKKLDTVMKAFLPDLEIEKSSEIYHAGFNATYSWIDVLSDMFRDIYSGLKDGSRLEVSAENNEIDTWVVENGRLKAYAEIAEDEETA